MNKGANRSRASHVKRVVSVGLGVVTIGVSVLVGALTSAAAADDEARLPKFVATPAPLVEPGTPVVVRQATADMRIVEGVQAHRGTAGNFAAPSRSFKSGCTIDFNDADALAIQPENAISNFVADPWRERCGQIYSEVTGTKYSHLHLDFVANDIGPCLDGLDPLGGSFARLGTDDEGDQTCTAIDPLTEPRTSPRSHSSDEVVRFRMYDIDGYQPFRLDRIRVKDQAIRLCAQPIDAGEAIVWEAAEPGGLAGASCWTLQPGYWDLSNYTDNTGVVTMTGATNNGAPFAFDDIGVTDQS